MGNNDSFALGIDGCRAGWIAIAISESAFKATLIDSRQQLLGVLERAALTFIDIPIGLPECEASRRCDRLLRIALGPRYRSSVFNPPIRAAVYALSYSEACELNVAATGKKISKQAWNIVPKIRQLDELSIERQDLRTKVLESHPEFLFVNFNGVRPLAHKKKTVEGRLERLKILERFQPGVTDLYLETRSQYLKKEMADDDIVDALGLAIGARMAIGEEVSSLPQPADRDAEGIPMGIHYWQSKSAHYKTNES